MNILFETRGNISVRNCKVERYKRKWNSCLRSYVLQLYKNGQLFLPALQTARLPMIEEVNIELKLDREFEHCLICLDMMDSHNHQRILQLSTAVRSPTMSPYMIRDGIRVDYGKWSMVSLKLNEIVDLFPKPLKYLTRLRISGKVKIRNIYRGACKQTVTEVTSRYPALSNSVQITELEQDCHLPASIDALIESMELCRLSYNQALERIKKFDCSQSTIYRSKLRHADYRPVVEDDVVEKINLKQQNRRVLYQPYPIQAEWRRSSVNSSIDVLTEVDRDIEKFPE